MKSKEHLRTPWFWHILIFWYFEDQILWMNLALDWFYRWHFSSDNDFFCGHASCKSAGVHECKNRLRLFLVGGFMFFAFILPANVKLMPIPLGCNIFFLMGWHHYLYKMYGIIISIYIYTYKQSGHGEPLRARGVSTPSARVWEQPLMRTGHLSQTYHVLEQLTNVGKDLGWHLMGSYTT